MRTLKAFQIYIISLLLCAQSGHGRVFVDHNQDKQDHPVDQDVQNDQYFHPANVGKVVQHLIGQMKAMQAVQEKERSVLAGLEAAVAAQAKEIVMLRTKVIALENLRGENRDSLQQLSEESANYGWGIMDLKNQQTLLSVNFTALRDRVEDVTRKMETNSTQADHRLNKRLTLMEKDMQDLRSGLIKEKTELRQLQMGLQSFIYETEEKEEEAFTTTATPSTTTVTAATTTTTISPPTTSSPISQPFVIKNVFKPSAQTIDRLNVIADLSYTPDFEGSGDVSPLDAILSKLEEKENTIDNKIHHLSQYERTLKREVSGMHDHVQQQDVSLSKLETMYNNITQQLEKLNNKIENGQQVADVQIELKHLKEKIYNISQQWQFNKKAFVNISVESKNQLDNLHHLIKQNSDGSESMKTLFTEMNYESTQKYNYLRSQIDVVGFDFKEIKHKLQYMNSQASNAISEIGENFHTLRNQYNRIHDRLAHVEVKVLNASLVSCQKSNRDWLQESKLLELEKDLSSTNNNIDDVENKVKRVENNLQRVYKEFTAKSTMIDKLMTQADNITKQIPMLLHVQREVNNIVMDLPTDCEEKNYMGNEVTGVHLIKPKKSNESLRVFCEMDQNGGWTFIQRRLDGSVEFGRPWKEYKYGFGNEKGEFWIGNDNLHFLTSQANYSLLIEMWDIYSNYWYAQYNHFRVDNETNNYALHVGGYHGNASDSLSYSNKMAFSSLDRDNDASSTHCAKFYTSGWWYKHCHYSNLNGRYSVGIVWFNHERDEWMEVKRVNMKIRPIISLSTTDIS